MKRPLSILRLVIGLSLILSASLGSYDAHACGCSCAMVCDNRCQFTCSDCSIKDGIERSEACCKAAHEATGDTGPCAAKKP